MSKTIYLCGPITGMPQLNKDEFLQAQVKLQKANYTVLNPHDLIEGLDLDPKNDYEKIMKIVVSKMIEKAHEVATLKDWELSSGARREIDVARLMNIPVKSIVKYFEHEPSNT